MKKSRLNIVQNENTTIIKKKPNIWDCIIFAMIFIAGILLPILYDGLRSLELFWVAYVLCMLMNIATFASLFFGKIVLDSDKRELYIYNLCRETYRFDEVKEIKSFFEEGDADGGMDTHKVLFVFTNGHKSELRTSCQEQTEELVKLLNSIIPTGLSSRE